MSVSPREQSEALADPQAWLRRLAQSRSDGSTHQGASDAHLNGPQDQDDVLNILPARLSAESKRVAETLREVGYITVGNFRTLVKQVAQEELAAANSEKVGGHGPAMQALAELERFVGEPAPVIHTHVDSLWRRASQASSP